MHPPPRRCSNPERWVLIDRIQDDSEAWAKEYGIPTQKMREIAGIIATRVVIEIRMMAPIPDYFQSFCSESFAIAQVEALRKDDYKK
jgi:hypothetical protein